MAASRRTVMPALSRVSRGTALTLTGTVCASAGSFCAVTVTVGNTIGATCPCANSTGDIALTQTVRARTLRMRPLCRRAYIFVLMLKMRCVAFGALLAVSLPLVAQGPRRVALGDWPEMRGPSRDG